LLTRDLHHLPASHAGATILVHLDSSTSSSLTPVAKNRWSSRDDDLFNDGDDKTMLHDEEIHHWTHGLADDVWLQRLEASSSGSGASHHHLGRRTSGGRRRALTPLGFHDVPLVTPPAMGGGVPSPTPHASLNPNDARVDGVHALTVVELLKTASSVNVSSLVALVHDARLAVFPWGLTWLSTMLLPTSLGHRTPITGRLDVEKTNYSLKYGSEGLFVSANFTRKTFVINFCILFLFLFPSHDSR
jgi:hypothetical protein